MSESSSRHTRREFLRSLSLGAGGALLLPSFLDGCAPAVGRGVNVVTAGATGWDLVPEILARIVSPLFPARDFDVRDYGAIGDGVTDCSSAFVAAIKACSSAGGGRVTV